MIKTEIHSLGERFYKTKLMALKQNHQMQKDALENEFQKELNECNEFWEKKIENYNESSQVLQDELHQKHEEKLRQYEESLEESMPQVPKMSPEVLNLEYQIQQLVRGQRYKEAHALQRKAEDLKNKCLKKNESHWNNTKNNKLDHFIQKQEYEMQALCYKIDTGREELIKAREKDYQKLVSKYRVLRENMDDTQIMEYHRSEKNMKSFNPSSNLKSKANYNSMQGESMNKY